MKYYIIDDNIGTVRSLQNIVKSRPEAEICGFATDPRDALAEIPRERPDVVLVDLLMQEMDGISLVKELRKKNPSIDFVMISKVRDKEMVQQAYEAGVEYFISKPVNLVEVDKILNHVEEKSKLRGIMSNIKDIFAAPGAEDAPPRNTPQGESLHQGIPQSSTAREIDILLGSLGMLGEKGTRDICQVYDLMMRRNGFYNKDLLSEVANAQKDTVRNVEQRVRRAIKKGLTNAAHVGLDDFDNEIFAVYANYVFDFKMLKDEMNLLEGKGDGGARVNIARFMEGLMVYTRNK